MQCSNTKLNTIKDTPFDGTHRLAVRTLAPRFFG